MRMIIKLICGSAVLVMIACASLNHTNSTLIPETLFGNWEHKPRSIIVMGLIANGSLTDSVLIMEKYFDRNPLECSNLDSSPGTDACVRSVLCH